MKVFFICLMLAASGAGAQTGTFSRADSLRGTLSPLRSCYDVRFYHLDIRIDPDAKAISGFNKILFTATSDFTRMQVDLFANMKVDRILDDRGNPLPYEREFNAVYIEFPKPVRKGKVQSITFYYSGTPQEANRPPWEGGFTWTTDSLGNPWVAVTCQGTGASLWWPNKDHQSDEPDSMLISTTVPSGLMNISNGKLRRKETLADGWTRFDWFVSYPINNYNVTVNIGKYAHFSDSYTRGGQTLALDYYVMPYNLQRATVQFAQVKPMLEIFEGAFGLYPFPRDGYKLVECPHLGMEHQSAIAYGNFYLNGYRGEAKSAVGPASPIGLEFDFIIIHETAHEWWGNSLTSNDIADMWVHESFGAYAEAVYVEKRWGKDEAIKYVNAKKASILNDRPIIGPMGVNKAGSRDMYNKGQIVLHTLRNVIDNDTLWFSILKGLATTFRHRTLDGNDVFTYINTRTGRDLTYFFDQYFRHVKIPTLDAFVSKKGTRVTLKYRWLTDVEGFRMPVKVTTSPGTYSFITPTTSWQTLELDGVDPMQFKAAEDLFYINVRLGWTYIDPRKPD